MAPMFEVGANARARFGITAGPSSGNPDDEKFKLLAAAAIDAFSIGSGIAETAAGAVGSGSLTLPSGEAAKLYKKISAQKAKVWIRVTCEECKCVGMWNVKYKWQETKAFWYECKLTEPALVNNPNQSINTFYDNLVGTSDNNLVNIESVGKRNFLRILTECRHQARLAGESQCKK